MSLETIETCGLLLKCHLTMSCYYVVRVLQFMLCSTWNYCMKKVFLKKCSCSYFKRNETFREKPLCQSHIMPLMLCCYVVAGRYGIMSC